MTTWSLVSPLLLWVSVWCITSAKLIRNHLDWKNGHGETMQYAIKTRDGVNIKDEAFVENLGNVGLIYSSPCMYIEHCHIFTHLYHFANGTCAFGNTTCAVAVKANKDYVHSHLDLLEDVEWYTEIWERHRFKRRINFNDKNFTYQWHLVSRNYVKSDFICICTQISWRRGFYIIQQYISLLRLKTVD